MIIFFHCQILLFHVSGKNLIFINNSIKKSIKFFINFTYIVPLVGSVGSVVDGGVFGSLVVVLSVDEPVLVL